MNLSGIPGQRATQTQNYATGTPSSDVFNFMPTQAQGAGSNQYQSLPPWMQSTMNYSTSSTSFTGLGGGGYGGVFGSPTAYSSNYGLGVPQQGSSNYSNTGSGWTGAGGGPIIGGGPFSVEQPAYPNISNALANYVGGQIGQGVTPFNLPTALPFGGTTQPGQLNAMANPLLQNLMSYYQGGQSSTPGANTLATIANQGISALPEWQAMVQAQGQNINQNLQQLKEQSAGMGALAGSTFGNAAGNYLEGATAQQNALLGQLQQQNILQGQIPAAEQLMSGAQNFGQYAQGLNQQAIQNVYNEMIRTSPQYNPTLQMAYGLGTTYDPVLQRPASGGGVLGGIAGAAPGLMSTIASLLGLG